MRLSIRHRLTYQFAEPARNITRILRLTPRSFEGQHVVDWQIDVDTDCLLKAGEDGFGNLTHTFTARGPCESLSIVVTGEIDNFDAAGVVRGSAERMPIELYLRETPLTSADDGLRSFSQEAVGGTSSTIEQLHRLLTAVHETVTFEHARPDGTSAAAAFAEKVGNGNDLAHIFTACARHAGIPARVTSGYYLCPDRKRGISHTWSEAFIQGLGWTGFDAAHDICPQEAHVRLATGLDILGAAPIRGIGAEAVTEALEMKAPWTTGGGQRQWQGSGWQSQSQG